MKQLLAVLLLVGVLPGCSKRPSPEGSVPGPPPAASPAPASPGDDVRQELEANYQAIVAGFKNNDPSVWEAFLAPDFQLRLFDGQVKDRRWVSDYVRNNAKVFKVVSLSIRVKRLTMEGDDAVAVVEQESSRTFVDGQGRPHQLDVGAVQREVWARTPQGRRLRLVEEKEVLYLKQDGKPKGP
jgi:hypothetical protein